MDYKVTLAMPVYNVEKYVERALLSALNQTFDSIEFLIVDDKGTDRSMDIVRDIVSTHPRGKDVRIIDHVVNQGLGATRNSAIREAKGEYLFFMDSDDEITPNCIQLLYDTMQQTPSDVVIGSYKLCDEEGKVIDVKITPNKKYAGAYALGDDFFFKSNIYVQTWNKLYDVEFLRSNAVACIPGHINEDILFTFQIVIYAKSCVSVNKVTYVYYLLENSATNDQRTQKGYSNRLAKQYFEILQFKKNFLLEYPDAVDCLGVADNIVNSAIDYTLKLYLSDIDEKSKFEYVKTSLNFKEIHRILYPNLRSKRNQCFLFFMRFLSNIYCKIVILKLLRFAVAVRKKCVVETIN